MVDVRESEDDQWEGGDKLDHLSMPKFQLCSQLHMVSRIVHFLTKCPWLLGPQGFSFLQGLWGRFLGALAGV